MLKASRQVEIRNLKNQKSRVFVSRPDEGDTRFQAR